MRRSWSARLAAALLAVSSALTPAGGATLPACATHEGGAGMAMHMAGAGQAMHGHMPLPRQHAPADGAHRCCPGACASALAVALPGAATGLLADYSSETPFHHAGDVSPRGVADHFLPFASGPPPSR